MKLAGAAAMRRLDERAIREAGIPGHVLMERAGEGAARALLDEHPAIAGRPVAVICGKGNNGGDGLVIARVLRARGTPARAFVLADEPAVQGDPRRMLEAARRAGVPIEFLRDETALERARPAIAECAGLVDAILGTGLEREVGGLPARAIGILNALRGVRPILAVDIPSGVDTTTGAVVGAAVTADLTVSFGLAKLGHVLFPGAAHAGVLRIVDIGIPAAYVDEASLRDAILTREEALAALPPRPRDSHKGTFGHLLVLAGSPGKTGAAALAAQAAMRCGTGLVTLGAPESLTPILAAKLTEVMCEPLPETDARTLGRKALERLRDLAAGKSAIVLGPGISTHPETREMVVSIVRGATLPAVVDADALNALKGRTDTLHGAHGPRVLTPHPGEMGRLLGLESAAVNADRIGCARAFAERHAVVLVLKGAHTVIARPDGEVRVNVTGNPGMASGGMGDALTGMIGGFLAQGVEAGAAAGLAVYLHGLAADRAARERGMVGLLASDVIERLPRTIAELEQGRGDAAF